MTSDARRPSRGEPLEPDPMLGRTLADRYRIDALVARGGMAGVYRARDLRLERDVAVKVLAAPYSEDAGFTARFLEESRAAASISHPSIAHVYDSGSDGSAHYIVMELLEGHRTLRSVLEERGSLAPPEVVRIARELLGGLGAVHERGLVHCDVKAGNVMLGPGPAKLIDFGIARPPHGGSEGDTSIGTLQAMSPEQLHGEALGPPSDLFSLGTLMYEALSGRPPFPGRTPEEVSAAHHADPPAPPSALAPGIAPRLDDVVLQSLRRDPRQRFHNADAMARALEVAADDVAVSPTDETQVIPRAALAAPAAAVAEAPPEPRQRPVARPRRTSAVPRAGSWSGLATLAILAAAGLVLVLLVAPLLGLGRDPGTGEVPPSSAPAAPASAAANEVSIPAVIGLATDEAIALAREAGLNWRLECAQDASQPEGIIDQEPAAGTPVESGARFVMYSARIQDCR